MGEPSPQQKANLARIRDNQRRSRARRKEYLQELETKYRTCESIGAEASAEIQAAARKVLEENKRLRRLLRQQGLSEADIDGTDAEDSDTFPTATDLLNHMLSTKKACQPGSGCGPGQADKSNSSCGDNEGYKTGSNCGDGQACKIEDEEDSRRQSCASAPTPRQMQQQQQHQPIALAPAPASIAPRPASHEPLPSAPQRQCLQPLQHQHQHQHQSQFQQPFHYSHQSFIQQQQTPQYYMPSPSETSHASNTPVFHRGLDSTSQSIPTTYATEYPLYAPQPSGYGAPDSQILDWDMASTNAMQNPNVASYMSPPSAHSVPVSFASPTSVSNTVQYSGEAQDDNTSSCFVAAEVIRGMHSNAGNEVEAALGCGNRSGDCRVDNTVVFDLMDRYASV